MDHREEATRTSGVRHSTFVGVGVVFLVFLYLFSPFTQVFLGWFVDFEDNISHRVHEVTFGGLFAIIFVGVLAQLRLSTRNFAGLLQAAVAALTLAAVITATTGWEWTTLLYLVPLGALVLLHPGRLDVLRYRLQPHRGLVVLMALITYSLIVGFGSEFGKAANEVRQHQSHWGGMAAFALTLLVVGYLAALRVHGWPIMAMTVGVSVILYGTVSLRFRFDASSRPGATAVFAIIWGLGFLVTARRARPQPAIPRSEVQQSTRGEELPDGPPPKVPKKPSAALVWATVAAFAVNIALGASGFGVGTLPTLVVALVLLEIVVWRWWRWRRSRKEVEQEDIAAEGPPLAASRPRWVGIGAGFVAAVLFGGCGAQVAREISEPPVPHSIESTFRSYCITCHATGEQHATRIDPANHPHGELTGQCVECHEMQRPVVSATGSHAIAMYLPPAVLSVDPAPPSRDDARSIVAIVSKTVDRSLP